MINELITRVFCARDAAHRAHFKTHSYAQHMALGAFYDEVIDLIDGLVEAYQGQFGLVGDTYEMKKMPNTENIVKFLNSEADWIESNRDVIANGSPAIENLIDGVTACYLTTIYKLENLK